VGQTDLEILDESPKERNEVLCPPDVPGDGLLEQVIRKG
jgi:hypothetical protein